MKDIAWPPFLQKLVLGHRFNQPLEGVAWPASLRILMLGGGFDQAIDGVTWPRSLLELSLGVNLLRLPPGAVPTASRAPLDLGGYFRSVDAKTWQGSFQLAAESSFDKPITGADWPRSLRELAFGNHGRRGRVAKMAAGLSVHE